MRSAQLVCIVRIFSVKMSGTEFEYFIFSQLKIICIQFFLSLLICLGSTARLVAEPRDLDVFIDFEEVFGAEDFSLGELTNGIRFIGFKVQSVDNPNLAHSGFRALVLEAGEEGKILFDRGVNLLQFYAAETMSAGRIELRDRNDFYIHPNGFVEGLPKNINSQAVPSLQTFVAYSGDFEDLEDLNYTSGIREIKISNVRGLFVLDDLGYTLTEGPPNNVVFEDFEKLVNNPVFADQNNFTIGQSPVTATFTGGLADGIIGRPSFHLVSYNHSHPISNGSLAQAAWLIHNNSTGTITFETPATQVQFYAALYLLGDGEIKVYDTIDNLLTSRKDIARSIAILSNIPFTYFDFNAEELGAPGGIGKITYSNSPTLSIATTFHAITLDDFGFTPISSAQNSLTVGSLTDDLVLEGSGEIVGENILHPSGIVYDQVLLTGDRVKVQSRKGRVTRVSYIDENDDIVQVEFTGKGIMTLNLDPMTFELPAPPINYNQPTINYVKGRARVTIDEADDTTFISIFTVGSTNAENSNLLLDGVIYDAMADVSLIEIINSPGIGGVQCANTRFSGITGKVGVDAREVPVAVRVLIGDIDARDDAVPYLQFGTGSFKVNAPNPGLRVTGGDLSQSNGSSIIIAPSESTKAGFSTLISQNNIKSDNTDQPSRSIDAKFVNGEGTTIFIIIVETSV